MKNPAWRNYAGGGLRDTTRYRPALEVAPGPPDSPAPQTRILTEGSAQSVLNAGRAEQGATPRREAVKVPRGES